MAHTTKKQLMRALFAAGIWASSSLSAAADDAHLLIRGKELEKVMNEADVQIGNLGAGLIIGKIRSEFEALVQELSETEKQLEIIQQTEIRIAHLMAQVAGLRKSEHEVGLILGRSQESFTSASTSASSSSSSQASIEVNLPPYFDDIPDLSDPEGPMTDVNLRVGMNEQSAKRAVRSYASATDEDESSQEEYQDEGEEYQEKPSRPIKRARAPVVPTRYSCDLCTKTYVNKSGLYRHKRINHNKD